ncbi:MAG: hypothetical protein HW380_2062 [Magnetococcales bacterium]|nr:hypothetical protein [Magnetococcales bacterium]
MVTFRSGWGSIRRGNGQAASCQRHGIVLQGDGRNQPREIIIHTLCQWNQQSPLGAAVSQGACGTRGPGIQIEPDIGLVHEFRFVGTSQRFLEKMDRGTRTATKEKGQGIVTGQGVDRVVIGGNQGSHAYG